MPASSPPPLDPLIEVLSSIRDRLDAIAEAHAALVQGQQSMAEKFDAAIEHLTKISEDVCRMACSLELEDAAPPVKIGAPLPAIKK